MEYTQPFWAVGGNKIFKCYLQEWKLEETDENYSMAIKVKAAAVVLFRIALLQLFTQINCLYVPPPTN